MANRRARAAAAANGRPARDPIVGRFLILLAGLIWAALVFGFPAVVITALGLIPALVAFVVDRTPQKYGAICVAGLNFAGTAPFLMALMQGPNTMTQAAGILTDVYSWLAMYGAAAMGWLLFLGLPPMLNSFLKLRAQHRIAVLRAEQERLRREWGIESGPAAAP